MFTCKRDKKKLFSFTVNETELHQPSPIDNGEMASC